MGKRGNAGKGSVILYALLFAYLFVVLFGLFFGMSGTLCAPLYEAGLGWLYFALMGIMSTALGVIGSVFTTYSALYQAKDNELLLSMPVPPRAILTARMVMVYLMSLACETVVWIPAVIQYLRAAGFQVSVVFAGLLLLFILPLFALVLSCILGWVIALMSAYIPQNRKSAITLIISLGFIAAYYYVCTKASTYLQLILLNSEAVSAKVKTFLYPFYQMGYGAEGKLTSLLLFTAMILVLFAVTLLILSRSFVKLTTSRKGSAKIRYRAKAAKSATPQRALLRKEFLRFTGSATYMLNSGMGVIFTLVVGVMALIKTDFLYELLAMLPAELETVIPLVACALLAALSSTSAITAPSVSLEGNSLWIIRSLPVTPWQILMAKLKLHLLVVGIPMLFCSVVVAVVLHTDPVFLVLIPIFALAFVVFCAALGLLLGLRFPVLNYTSEMVPIKQSLSVMLALFIPWGILVVLAVLYFLLRTVLSPLVFLLLVCVLTIAASAFLLRTLKTKGTQRFCTL